MTVDQLAERLRRMSAGVPAAVKRTLTEVGDRSVRVLRDGMLSGNRLRARTGYLRNSATFEVTADAGGQELRVHMGRGGQPVRYAAIQEHGGIVTPVRGKFLAIPVGPALTPSGVAKFTSPRDVPDLHYVQSRNGQPMLVKLKGKGRGKRAGAIEVWFLLRRSVRIEGKHYMRDTSAIAIPAVREVLAERLSALASEVA